MPNNIRPEIKTLAKPIGDFRTHERNVRQGDIGAICTSLEAHGQYRPIVVHKETNQILAGNHTFLSAQALGWDKIAVTFVDCDEEQAMRILLADNRSNDLATYDDSALMLMLQELATTDIGLIGTLYDGDDLDALINDLGGFHIPDDVDDVPDAVPAVSKLGDVWLLGKHRVRCGDSTSHEEVKELMNGLEADLVWTDPPYGVAYVGKTKDALTIENDDMDIATLQAFLMRAFTAGHDVTKKGGCWYVTAPSGNLFQAFSIPLTDLGIWRHTLVWIKDMFVMGRADYHYRHESIFYGWKEGSAHQTPPDRTQDTVWEIPRPKRSTEHPTMKPVELITKAIMNSTNRDQIVLDLFGGSGSTLIACQETNRIGYLMELDPHYVDVICARFQKHTGIKPILEATGATHDFIEATGE
jgi:DNA modification methylase